MQNTDDIAKPLMHHILELRRRILYVLCVYLVVFILSYNYSATIYNFLAQPLWDVLSRHHNPQRMIYTALTEAFFTYLKVSFFTATVMVIPFAIIQIWYYVKPGLYNNEKKILLPLFVASPMLFLLGAASVYYFIIPIAWDFLINFQYGAIGDFSIQLEAKISEYLSLVMSLILAFGISFQLPLVLVIMARAKIISADFLVSKRKYAVIIIFIAAAILTPPDVITQISLAIPLVLLYELSIFAVKMLEKHTD